MFSSKWPKNLTFFSQNNLEKMKKYIFIQNPINVMERLLCSQRVEGVLYIDQDTGILTFKAYNRQPRNRRKDMLVKKLPWGWVKESIERVKLFVSVPKDLGTATTLGIIDQQTREAKDALIDRELIEFC